MGWIGVDFDGTLSEHPSDNWPEPGRPIPMMVQRVKNWLAQGIEVRIVTARVSGDKFRASQHRIMIQDFCREHIGQALEVTNEKDYGMLELWDDRAVQVVPNTGLRADGRDDPSEKI